MTTCITVISLITNKETSDKGYVNGSAMYQSNQKNYKYFDFKLFDNPNNKDIHSFEEGDIVILTGKFSFRNDYDGAGKENSISFAKCICLNNSQDTELNTPTCNSIIR